MRVPIRGRRPSRRQVIGLALAGLAAGIVPSASPAAAIGPNGPLRIVASTATQPDLSDDGRFVAYVELENNDEPFLGPVVVKDQRTGQVRFVSVTSTGRLVDAELPSISRDGSRVAFGTTARLLPLDTDAASDVYVRDLTTGGVYLASAANHVDGNGSSRAPSLSADGTRVAFESTATNLSPRDRDSRTDVYVKDLGSARVTLVSATASGVKANRDAYDVSLSGDGRVAAFTTGSDNLDPRDSKPQYFPADVYVKNVDTGGLRVESTTGAGVPGNCQDDDPSLSPDGGFLAFASVSSNLPGGVDCYDDFSGNIYVKNLRTGALSVVGGVRSSSPSLSAGGRFVAFDSSNCAGSGDGSDQACVADVRTGRQLVLSQNARGEMADGYFVGDPSLAADGRTVVFDAVAYNLGDPRGRLNVYLRRLTT